MRSAWIIVAALWFLGSANPALGENPSVQAGRRAYGERCAPCHGLDGRGVVPALDQPDAFESAGEDYYRLRIASGHGGAETEPLPREEVEAVLAFLRTWQAPGESVAEALAVAGDPGRGRSLYRGLCAPCHGRAGQGGIGGRIASPSFLAIASDEFLARTILDGRPGTAMRAWRTLPPGSVADLVAFLRGWMPEAPAYDAVTAARLAAPAAELEGLGREIFRRRCQACHGEEGGGGIGPRLASGSLLGVAGPRFLYETIVRGRPSTAMPAWPGLSARELAALIALLDSWAPGDPEALAAPGPGDASRGSRLYAASCAACHGPRGEGGTGTQLANPEFLRAASDAMLARWVLHEGAPSGAAPDLVAHLRDLGRAGPPPPLVTSRGDPEVGQEVYEEACEDCHGPEGNDVPFAQLSNPTFLRSASDGFLTATIVLGRFGTSMAAQTDPDEPCLDPERIQDVIAYMRRWGEPETWRPPVPGVDTSRKAIEAGREDYARYCAACHGPTGGGRRDGPSYFAPALADREFLAAASDGFLLATIATGRRGTPMRAFGAGTDGIAELDPATIRQIVAFLRSLEAGGR